MKKLVSYLLVVSMLFALMMPASYALVNGDTPGEKTLDIELGDYKSIANGEYSNGSLKVNAGGKVTYQLFVPFRTAKVVMNYSLGGEYSNLTLYFNDEVFTKKLLATDNSFNITPNILKGEHQLVFSFDQPIEIYQIQLQRAVMWAPDMRASYQMVPDYTELDDAIQTAVIMATYSPVIMVNGGRRYVNNDDPREVPYIENGEIYLPIHSFARAFEYYYEERDNEWVIMNGTHTFHYKNGVLTRQDYSEEPWQIADFSRRVNGKTYIGVKYFAELSDKVVKARDGMFVVDYPSNVDDILADNIYNQLVEEVLAVRLMNKTGKTYYVSKECNACDTNDGSKERPFATIQQAADIAQAGDTVIIGGGKYHELVKPKNNGTASNPITFKAAEGEEVILTATAELGAPIGTQTNVYGQEMLVYNALTDLGYGKNQLFYKNDNLNAGRHPNENTNPTPNVMPEDLAPVWATEGNIKADPTDYTANLNRMVSDTDLEQPEGHWVGATVVALRGMGYALCMAKVTASGPSSVNEDGEKVPGYIETTTDSLWWFKGTGEETDYAYLTNHINTVDKAGEWHLEDGKIYIIPPEGETAETLKLEQKIRHVLIDISENKFIRIEGINTYGGSMKMNNSEMCMLRDGTYEYISHYTFSKDQRDGYVDKRDKYNADSNPQRGELGIYIGGSDNVVINNTLRYSAGAGVYVIGSYGYFENNLITDCGYMSSYVGGLFISHDYNTPYDDPRGGHLVYGNSLTRAGRHVLGISTNEDSWTGPDNVVMPFIPDEVAYNDIYDGAVASRDTAPWYQYNVVAGTERLKSRHHNNVLWNSWANEGSMNSLVYYDGLTGMAQYYDNVMFHTNDAVRYDMYVFLQDSRGAETITDTWGNVEVGYLPEGKGALTKSDYPNGKIFRSGVTWLSDDQTPYLNSIEEDVTFINLEKAKISQTAVIDDGLFVPSQNGDWICFEDVDFGQKGSENNALDIGFVGDPCNTGDKLTVMIGDSMDKPVFTEEAQIDVIAPSYDVVDTYQIRYNNIFGKKNVYIRVDDLKSFKLAQIDVYRVEDKLANLKAGIYAQEGTVEKGSAKLNGEIVEKNKTYYQNTSSSTIKFDDFTIPEDCNELQIRLATAQPYNKHAVDVRIGSPDGEIISSFVTEKWRWWDYQIENFELNRTLEAGTYDIYVCFGGDGKSSNFLWFGLGYNDAYNEAQAEEITENVNE